MAKVKLRGGKCVCRHCGDIYGSLSSRSTVAGYCGMSCMRDEAKRQGFRKGKSWEGLPTEVEVLTKADKVGHVVPMDSKACFLVTVSQTGTPMIVGDIILDALEEALMGWPSVVDIKVEFKP
jgi:hypothetical protein